MVSEPETTNTERGTGASPMGERPSGLGKHVAPSASRSGSGQLYQTTQTWTDKLLGLCIAAVLALGTMLWITQGILTNGH